MPRSDTYPGSLDRRPSGSWRWRVSVDGERIQKTWDADLTPREAARRARRTYNRLEKVYATGEGGAARVGQLLALYREEKLPELAEETVRGYEYDLTALETFFVEGRDNPRIRDVGRGDVKAFLGWRKVHYPDGGERPDPLSAHSLQRAQSVTSGVFREAVEREWIPANPARRISIATPDREYVLLSEEEYEALLAVAESHPMLRMHLLLCGEAGLRKSESLDLRWSDLDLEEGFLQVVAGREGRTTKGGQSRYVPLTTRLRAELRRHALQYRGREYDGGRSPYVVHHTRDVGTSRAGDPYSRLTKVLHRLTEEVGLPEEWRLHDLRHRRCTQWLAEGYSPEKVRRAMGHADLRTTLRYSHLVRSDLEEMVGEAERDELSDMVG